jgi:hypothetical protein
MGQRSYCLLAHLWSCLATSDLVAGAKEERSVEKGGGVIEWGKEDVGIDFIVKWNFVILSEKLAKVCAREGDE